MSTKKGLELVDNVKSVSRETRERLTVFYGLLCQWQARMNLISPASVEHIWERHMADSMQCSALFPETKHLVDIGSGAGFPGMVMAIVMAETGEGRVEFVESNGKKCAFLQAVVRETGLKQAGIVVRVHHGRIENVLLGLDVPELITARAVAPLKELLGLTKGFLSRTTVGLFPKGRGHRAEITEAEKSWKFDCKTVPSRFEEGSVLLEISGLKSR